MGNVGTMNLVIIIWVVKKENEKETTKYIRRSSCANAYENNSEFRIKYPRGELGQSSGEAELFMLVEHLAGVLEEVDKEVKSMRNNAVNIEFLKDRTKKLTEDVEKLIRNGNGSH